MNDFHEIVYPLPPLHEKVFSASMFEKLKIIYAQLYPGSTINHFSQFYYQFRRLHYASEMIGSGKKSKDGIIMAFWPGHGNSLQNTDTSRCQCSNFLSISYVSLTQGKDNGITFVMYYGSILMNSINTSDSPLQ